MTDDGLARRPAGLVAAPLRLALLVGTTLGLTAVSGVFFWHSGYAGSDFFSLRDAQQDGLSLGFLLRPVFDHFVPGHRFVNWVVQSIAPLDFRLAAIISAVVFAASLLVMHRLLAELFRPGPWCLLLTLFYGASAIHVATGLYWAASLSRLPADALGLASMTAHLRYRRTGRTALLAWSVGLFAAALLFSESAALYLFLLVALRVLVLAPEESPVEAVRAAVREWAVWVPYLLALLIPVLGSATQSVGNLDPQGPVGVLRYLATAWFQAFVPAVTGQFVNSGELSGPEITMVVASQLVILAVAVWSVVRRPWAWRAWVMVALAFVATQLPVGLLRTGFFSPEHVAHQYRYYSEVLAAFTIALGVAFVPVRSETRTGSEAAARPSPLWIAGIATLSAVYVGSSLWTSARLTDGYDGRRSGRYVAALRADLRGRGDITVLDGDVPEFVIPPLYAPFNRLSTVVPLARSGAAMGTAGADLHRVGPDGHLRPVSYTPKEGGPAAQLASTPIFGAVPTESQYVDGEALCVNSGEPASALGYNLRQPAADGEWYLTVRYRTPGTSLGHVLVDRGGEFVHAREPALPLHGDLDRAIVALGPGGFRRVVVVLPEGFRLCVDEVVLATVEPRAE